MAENVWVLGTRLLLEKMLLTMWRYLILGLLKSYLDKKYQLFRPSHPRTNGGWPENAREKIKLP